ncbi:hypothetical protein GGR50DRAFT_666545 [Xylaria sp. CBS 124048]|nr:hypothetical protein GGR50DRAFT_666545 [Xylaria sp. CBS 124048]
MFRRGNLTVTDSIFLLCLRAVYLEAQQRVQASRHGMAIRYRLDPFQYAMRETWCCMVMARSGGLVNTRLQNRAEKR